MNREFAVMKNGSGCGRFFGFALSTPSGIRSLTLAIIIIAAFPANKTNSPFKLSQEPETFFITMKKFFKLLF